MPLAERWAQSLADLLARHEKLPSKSLTSRISINPNEIAILGGRNDSGEEKSSIFIYDTTEETASNVIGRFRKLHTSSD